MMSIDLRTHAILLYSGTPHTPAPRAAELQILTDRRRSHMIEDSTQTPTTIHVNRTKRHKKSLTGFVSLKNFSYDESVIMSRSGQ